MQVRDAPAREERQLPAIALQLQLDEGGLALVERAQILASLVARFGQHLLEMATLQHLLRLARCVPGLDTENGERERSGTVIAACVANSSSKVIPFFRAKESTRDDSRWKSSKSRFNRSASTTLFSSTIPSAFSS
jgi:hypothetical protein